MNYVSDLDLPGFRYKITQCIIYANNITQTSLFILEEKKLTTLHYRYLGKEKNKSKCLPAKNVTPFFYVGQPNQPSTSILDIRSQSFNGYIPYELSPTVPGVPQYWLHFVFFIFSGSGARTEELLTFFQQPRKFAT